MKTVIMRGPTCTQSGYGVHARQIARTLLSHPGLDTRFFLTPWGMTPWLIDREACEGLIGKIISRETNSAGPFDVSVQVQLPNEWKPEIAKFNIGVTAGVETDICNTAWIEAINRMNHVIVPSTFVMKTFVSSGRVTTPISVIPEAFHDACTKVEPLDIDFSTSFNFLLFGQMMGNPVIDRKNTANTIKWLCDVFHDDKDVGIVIKTNLGKNTCLDKQETVKVLSASLKLARKGDFPRVHLLHGSMTDDEVCSLYRHPSVKALVSATKGEGFGLPILEAAASGLPVLATNWSGHLDVMSVIKRISFDYNLLPVNKQKIDGSIFVPGSKWAEVDEADFKKKVLRFRTNPTVPAEWAQSGRETILSKFNQAEVSKMYYKIIDSVE